MWSTKTTRWRAGATIYTLLHKRKSRAMPAGSFAKINLGTLDRFWETPRPSLDEYPSRMALIVEAFRRFGAMRIAMRVSVCILVGVCCCPARADAETGSHWWSLPWSKSSEPTQSGGSIASAQPPRFRQHAPATAVPGIASGGKIPESAAVPPSTSLTGSSTWPSLHMPKVALPNPHLGTKDPVASARNSWVEAPRQPVRRTPLQAMNDGAHKVGNSTKSAWHKTVDALTPGSKEARPAQTARREVQPPFWKRMLGDDGSKLQGPQTVPQWMAQQRLDP
jgi:hypothetical protein